MDKIFESIFSNESAMMSYGGFFLCLGVALVSGFVFALLCRFKTQSSKGFFINITLLPAAVAVVIMLVNGQLGTGLAVAGAFALVRFRSAAGSAKEICMIFAAMASGLAFGTGYLAYGVIFLLVAGGVIFLLTAVKLWEKKPVPTDKLLRITIPEDLDYGTVFDDLFATYTKSFDLVKVKSVNMGSMFRVTYHVVLKDVSKEKQFLDDLRCRNGNLEVSLVRTDYQSSEL